ncbi:unnamed protein product [Linum trigynum]|uniref:KAT8 regulatory NSL complex subunit 2 n=1 Tax=Linum trigynum TaxID=586398 RepID=A0AAV2G1Y9_9ROSI
MTAAAQHHHNPPPSSSKPPRNSLNPTSAAAPPSSAAAPSQTLNSNNPTSAAAAAETAPIALHDRNHPLSHATHLTRHELLKRRSHLLKQVSRCYRDHYWALMEEVKGQYREYYWKYGVSPFKEERLEDGGEGEREREGGNFSSVEAMDESNHGGNLPMGAAAAAACGGNNNNGNLSSKGEVEMKNCQSSRCKSPGCRLKAMALTAYCHLHILCDTKQKLYKACTFVIKSAQAGPITCGKPILRSIVPALCSVHFQKAQQQVTRALKKAGLNVSSSSKLAPKLHVIVAEYVRQIQAKRKAAKRANLIKDAVACKEVKTEVGSCSAVKS